MGAQTNAIYYWNGGAPAPMVSPNASSGSYTGGSATFQDRLIQYVGPNPGSPAGDATCQLLPSQYYCEYQQLGEMYIQLSYLTNPQYSSGLLNDGNPPVMTATVDSTGNYIALRPVPDDRVADHTVRRRRTDHGGTEHPGEYRDERIRATPQNADWLVNFFGVNADGQPVYIQESVANTTNGVSTPIWLRTRRTSRSRSRPPPPAAARRLPWAQ